LLAGIFYCDGKSRAIEGNIKMPHLTKLIPDVLLNALNLTLNACGGTATANPPGTVSSPVPRFDIKAFRFSRSDVSGATFYRLLENHAGSSASAMWVVIYHKARKRWNMLCRSMPVSIPVTSCKKKRKHKPLLQNAFVSNRSGVF